MAFVPKSSVGEQSSTFHIESNGVDSFTCGSPTDPCRSLTTALIRARDGDWIIVGPGRYGNLDNDANIGEQDEEGGGSSCACYLVGINKRVSIVSVKGASETIIDAQSVNPDGSRVLMFGVRIAADGVTFGAPGHGFTISGSATDGLTTTYVRGVRIAGNVFTRNNRGANLRGARNLLTSNVAIANDGAGFEIQGDENVAWRNTSIYQGDGFLVDGNHTLLGNVSNGNVIGYAVVAGGPAVLTHNAAVGNNSIGVRLAEGTSAILRRNNLYANGAVPWDLYNCGVHNNSGNQIYASQNYWGASSGSGADPADDACDISGVTIRQPFAEKRFEIAGASAVGRESDWADVVRFLESNAEAGIAEALSLE